MEDKHGELLDGLDWYWSRKMEAYRGFESMNALTFSASARRFYGEYFLYLVSAIELLSDFDKSFNDSIETIFDGYGGHSGKNNFQYVRLLRHAIIHRGADVTNAGVEINGIICPLAPPTLTERRGGWSFARLSPFLTVIVFFCEAKVGPAIEAFMERKKLWDRDPVVSLKAALDMLRNMEHASAVMKQEMEMMMNEQMQLGTLPFNTFQTLRTSLKSGESSEADLQGLLIEAEEWWVKYQSSLSYG